MATSDGEEDGVAKFIALWADPDDVAGFEQHYRDVHSAIASRFPRVRSSSATKVSGNPAGGTAAYHLVFEATFASQDDLDAMLASPEWQESGKDARHMMRQFGVKLDMVVGTDF